MVVYYDTVNDPNRVKTDIWTQYSKDGGNTWSPAVQVTTKETDESTGNEDIGNQYGDYIGMTGYSGRYFASWTDRRGGGDRQNLRRGARHPGHAVQNSAGHLYQRRECVEPAHRSSPPSILRSAALQTRHWD